MHSFLTAGNLVSLNEYSKASGSLWYNLYFVPECLVEESLGVDVLDMRIKAHAHFAPNVH